MIEQEYGEPSFDDEVDEIKRELFLDRLGPPSPLKKRSYGLTKLDVIASICIYASGLPIAIALKSLL